MPLDFKNDFENAGLCLGLWPQHGLLRYGFVLHENISNGAGSQEISCKSNEGIVLARNSILPALFCPYSGPLYVRIFK